MPFDDPDSLDASPDADAPLRLLPTPTRGNYPATQAGLAERTLARFSKQLLYVPEAARAKWFTWQGNRWAPSEDSIKLFILKTARSLGIEASQVPDENQGYRKELLKLALCAETASFIEGTASIAVMKSGEFGCRRSNALLNPDPYLLNCANGAVDLRTGRLIPSSPLHYMTRNTDVEYHADIDPNPLWQKFLDAMLPDPEVQHFVQIAVGASLTGSPMEETFFFLHGPGGTGKSTFLAALRGALGDTRDIGYYQTASFETFLKGSAGAGPRPDLAGLQGARIVMACEVDDDRRFSSATLKMLTGRDGVTARHLYGELITYMPTFTLWLASNSRPAVSAEDSGFWRRLIEIPFLTKVAESARDPKLKQALAESRHCHETVLAWAVQGCLLWQQEGFKAPRLVKEAITDYRNSCDDLGLFLSEACELNPQSQTPLSYLREVYSNWCAQEGTEAMDPKKFKAAMEAKGLVWHQTKTGRVVKGLKVVK